MSRVFGRVVAAAIGLAGVLAMPPSGTAGVGPTVTLERDELWVRFPVGSSVTVTCASGVVAVNGLSAGNPRCDAVWIVDVAAVGDDVWSSETVIDLRSVSRSTGFTRLGSTRVVAGGNARVWGSDRSDTVRAAGAIATGSGADLVFLDHRLAIPNRVANKLWLGSGNDTVRYLDGWDAEPVPVTVYGGAGNDAVELVSATRGTDTVYGEDGNDTISVNGVNGSGVSGGNGDDSVFWSPQLSGGFVAGIDLGAGSDTLRADRQADGPLTIKGSSSDPRTVKMVDALGTLRVRDAEAISFSTVFGGSRYVTDVTLHPLASFAAVGGAGADLIVRVAGGQWSTSTAADGTTTITPASGTKPIAISPGVNTTIVPT